MAMVPPFRTFLIAVARSRGSLAVPAPLDFPEGET
jgi:hypothetical protein